MTHALIVDDDIGSSSAMAELISREGFSTATATTLHDARKQMALQRPDVILLDIHLPDGSGLDLFPNIDAQQSTEVVLITGHASLETSIEALRLGAADYLIKPINIRHLKNILSRVARPSDLKEEINKLRDDLRSLGRFGRLIGRSPPMQKLYDHISRVAPTAATVLLTGESGTGKEVVAQTLHELSRRKKAPFLPVNAGAISPQLIESELFGHEKGSFTGAVKQHAGYFERASGGTLFLDEITEMPIDLQSKLLRVLETGTFMRVGSNVQTETDVRVIAATNRSPEDAVAKGRFRADLLYRLQVFPIFLPPLRERTEDIELLVEHFLAELNQTESTHKTVDPEIIELLSKFPWPGNVRELKNTIHRAYIMADDIIDKHCLPPQVSTLNGIRQPAVYNGSALNIQVGMKIADAEQRLIYATLEHCGGSKEKTADMLGISLKTLYNRFKEYSEDTDPSQ